MVVTSSRDKESSTPTVSVHRWRALKAPTATAAKKALFTEKMRRHRSGSMTRARQRVGGASVVPFYLPDHHIAEALGRIQADF